MARGIEIPITPTVLSWAIKQSGFDEETLANKLNVSIDEIRGWMSGDRRPLKTKFKRIAEILKRPTALFFLPEPPSHQHSHVSFRHPDTSERDTLNPKELRYLREIGRIQQTLGWAREELDEPLPSLGSWPNYENPEVVANAVRNDLAVDAAEQMSWKSVSAAQAAWRSAIEAQGVLVFLLPLGERSVRGFSVWDDRAPAIAVNTWWNNEARIFGMLHEYGHLITRSNSACLDASRQLRGNKGDPIERWCERFAASVILPWDEVVEYANNRFGWTTFRTVSSLDQVYALSRKFRVSARATAIRLIEKGYANWSLYWEIPGSKDKKQGGGAMGGRNRLEIRCDEYGNAVPKLFVKAVDQDLIERTDALAFLKVSDADLDHWRA